jgi:N-acetyl sugar amidotransferase
MKCVECLLPDTKEGITFDKDGVCNVCVGYKNKKEIDWDKRKKELNELCDSVRGKQTYDCVVPFSGGKDSTYQLWYVITQLKLKPLVVSFDHGFFRDTLKKNRKRTLDKLGCDFISVRPHMQVVKEIIKVSIQLTGEFCCHCHNGVYGMSMQIADKFKIPIVFWGQASAEYGSYSSHGKIEKVDLKQHNERFTMGITSDKMFQHLSALVSSRDLDIYRFPSDYKGFSVRLGSFIPWDARKNAELIKEELGWEGDEVEGIPSKYWWEKIECRYQGVRDYLLYLRKGFGRTAHLTAIDIREGRMSKGEAHLLTTLHDGVKPKSLTNFLEFIDTDEDTLYSWMSKLK